MKHSAVKHTKSYQCYACTIQVGMRTMNRQTEMHRFLMYESIVEYIEAQPPDRLLHRMEIWRDMGKGYSQYTMVWFVLRDMWAHGLLEPARMSRNGKMVFAYRRIV